MNMLVRVRFYVRQTLAYTEDADLGRDRPTRTMLRIAGPDFSE